VAAVGGGRGGGVACYLLGGLAWIWEVSWCEERAERGGQGEGDRRGRGEGVSSEQRVLTGLVGREEMILSIDSRRSGYISARRTSRSVSGGG